MASKRRRRPRQASIEFRPRGRGGARPGAGRPRTRRSRVPHRSRGGVPGHCPVLVTLRVLDDVPGLRCAQFVGEFRKTLRKGARRPGFRVVHYSIQDDHAHFLVEAQGKVCLANGMRESGRPLRALRESRVRSRGACTGGPLPPRGEAHADGGAAGARVRAAERPQALLAASAPRAAGGARRRELRALVRRLEGSCAAAGAIRGPRSPVRGGAGEDLAAVQGLAPHRPDRSGRGSGRVTASRRSRSARQVLGCGRVGAAVSRRRP